MTLRHTILILITACFMTAFGQNKTRVTIVKYHNQNPSFKFTSDTLLKDSVIDLTKTKIDLHFTYRTVRFPYDMPSVSLFKEPVHEKECDMKNYPRKVKCYKYDSLKRVTELSVESSGMSAKYLYTYDSANRVIKFSRVPDIYIVEYNPNGTLKQIKQVDAYKNSILYNFFFTYR